MKTKQKHQTPDLMDFEEPKQELIFELNKIMIENKIWPQKIFIVGKKNYLLVYQNIISNGVNQEDFGTINPGHLKRGDILDSFSKIELIVNEIIEAKVLGENGQKQEFSDITNKIDLSQKIHLLKSWELIGEKTFSLLHKVRKVRNILAHSWHIKNAIYETDKTLETNFPKFQSDLKLIWKRLINVYDFVKPQNKELKKVLKKIKEVLEKK
jgi:uncharacterized protein YutE (UPF0331/DUF86 family)